MLEEEEEEMLPNRRESAVQMSGEEGEEILSDRPENQRIATLKRTSPCRTSVLNMGSSPRITSTTPTDTTGDDSVIKCTGLPRTRRPRDYLPSQQQIITLMSRSVIRSERPWLMFALRRAVQEGERTPGEEMLCNTPISCIQRAFGRDVPISRLRSLTDMFPAHGTVSDFLSEFFIMDVILNRHVRPDGEDHDDGTPVGQDKDPDKVVTVWCYKPEELSDEFDYKFRTAILFLPQAGVFYCARERRKADVGIENSFIPIDMSWLRMERHVTPPTSALDEHSEVYYTFGKDGYVKSFSSSKITPGFPDGDFVSAWRISKDRIGERRRKRVIYRANQCHDKDGPMMAPDVFNGEDAGTWPQDLLRLEYNCRLSSSNSARMNGRHYASGCHHYHLPNDCWIIDPTCDDYNNVDICIDVATVGRCANRQSVVMIRNLLVHDVEEDRLQRSFQYQWEYNIRLFGACSHIALTNTLLHKRSGNVGAVRSSTGDVGMMYALGTGVDLDGISVYGYAANHLLPERQLRHTVKSLAHIGEMFFPQVLAVSCDTEYDTGACPICPMEGDPHKRRSVGFTIDTSVNLGNSSHVDVHDGSQGYGVWTEIIPGRGKNWYYIMPNVYGTRPHQVSPDGGRIQGKPFAGLAIKLTHGVAISWDGRVIRHCTSLSHPDGWEGERIGDRFSQQFTNNLYGTFTAAKERVVNAGRAQCRKEWLEEARREVDDERGSVGAGTARDVKKRKG